MRCPKCNSRSMIHDYDDSPGRRERAMLCVCCGKRVVLSETPKQAAPTPRR